MFKYKISDLADADNLCDTWATKCVSLLGPKYKDFYKTTPKRLVVFFDDIDFIPKQPSRLIAPSISLIRQVFAFTKFLNDNDRLLVHCKAGISRSTAMLIGILCQHGLTAEEAFNAVRKEQPRLWPNNFVIRICDELLQYDSQIVDVVADFKEKNARQPTLREFITIVEDMI